MLGLHGFLVGMLPALGEAVYGLLARVLDLASVLHEWFNFM